MGRRFECPLEGMEDAYVVLPDEWLGEHLMRRDKAVKAHRKLESEHLLDFGVALALAEDWGNIPGLDGKPDNWDFTQIRAKMIVWISQTVLRDFNGCFDIPKVPSSPSETGSMVTTAPDPEN